MNVQKKSKKNAIALIIGSLDFGGAERQLVQLANGLPKDIFDVHVICLSNAAPLASDLDKASVNLHILEKRSKFDISLIWRLGRLFKENDIQVCHAFFLDAELSAVLCRPLAGYPPVIVSERNSGYPISTGQKLFRKITLSMANHCIANSHEGKRYSAELFGQPESKYTVVYNGVDIDRFHPTESNAIRRELKLSEKKLVIGMIASFKPQKNHFMLIRTLKILRESGIDTAVLLVGDSLQGGNIESADYKSTIVKEIRDAGLTDSICALGKRDDLPEIYAACDLTVLTSNHEGTPNVVLESLACGTPVLATEVSDNARILADCSSARLVAVDDDQSLASAIEEFAKDREMFSQATKEGPEFVRKNFSISTMVDATQGVYKCLLG